MRKYIFISLGILVVGVCSCRRGAENPEEIRNAMREDVVFTASASSYLTKASDSALEDGDAVGIFAMEPIDVINVKGTVKGSAVTPERPVKWELNQKKANRFVSFMPYQADSNSWDYTFYVKPDQSGYDAYRASDLRYSVIDALPGQTVSFLFQHALSKLVVVMEDGEEIQSVTTGEIALSARLNLVDGSVQSGTYKGTATLGKAVDGNGGRGFVAILVPQTGKLPLTVTLSGGQKVRATLDQAASLEPGVAYLATISSGADVRYSLSIIPWADGGQMSYGKPKQEES